LDCQRKKNILKIFEKEVMGLKWIAIEKIYIVKINRKINMGLKWTIILFF